MSVAASAAARRRILITRPRIDAEPFARILAERTIDSLIEPLMQAVVIPEAAADLSDVQAVLATSANGVRAFAAREPRRDLPLCAVGAATAAIARTMGFTQIEVAGGDVDALAAMIIARRDPTHGALLHVAGTVSAGNLAGALAAAGFDCRRAVLYRMEPATAFSAAARRALIAGTVSGVALYSPRTAEIFADLIGGHDLVPACRYLTAFCLSSSVAARTAHLPWARQAIAARPDQAAMVAAIVDTLAQAR